MSQARSGYTLPVFACAAAIAALKYLQRPQSIAEVSVELQEPAEIATIAIEQVAALPNGSALAITRSDPGDNLDLTRHTPIWALVEWGNPEQREPIQLQGGEGIGRMQDGEAAIYSYAQRLFQTNLKTYLRSGQTIQVTIVLPEGRALAQRTSNAAFGIVDGLALLGTSGISQPLSTPEQLMTYRTELRQKAAQFDTLVFCIGENGLDLAAKLGINPNRLLKTANWLGPLLAEAGMQGLKAILLFGYHGKLLKLAGSVFHTHHHVADGRLEILTAHCANLGLPTAVVQAIFASATAEDGLQQLQSYSSQSGQDWVQAVYGAIAEQIDHRSQTYIYTHTQHRVTVGSVLFNRSRQTIASSERGLHLLNLLTQTNDSGS